MVLAKDRARTTPSPSGTDLKVKPMLARPCGRGNKNYKIGFIIIKV